jgi:hypothetical protein
MSPAMREHICIRRPEYVAGTKDRPEVGVFTQTSVGRKPVPWGRLAAGETVWMKWTGGPVVARAVVSGYRQFEDCTPARLRDAVSGFALAGLDRYWESLAPQFDAVAIYLDQEEWLDEPLTPTGRSRSSSWIVLAGRAERERWMTTPPKPRSTDPMDPRGPRSAPPALRFAVFRRDSYTCQNCGRRERWSRFFEQRLR